MNLTAPRIFLIFQLEGVIGICARVSPGEVQFPAGKVEDQGIDGLAVFQRGSFHDRMIADRIRVVDMVLLDGLQGFNRVFSCALKLPDCPEVAHA